MLYVETRLTCAQVLHAGRELNVTRALHDILEKSFPEEYAARRQEAMEASPSFQGDASAPIPLFVMSCLLPGALHAPHAALQSDCILWYAPVALQDISAFMAEPGCLQLRLWAAQSKRLSTVRDRRGSK